MNLDVITKIVAAAGVISTIILSYKGFNRSKKADETTAKAGAVEQIINGLNILVESLQEDNKTLREQVKELRSGLENATKERDSLKRQVEKLHIKYGQAS